MKSLDIEQIQKQLTKFTQDITLCKTNKQINNLTESLILSLVNSEYASVWMYNQEHSKLIRERSDNFQNEINLQDQKGVMYEVFMTKKSHIYNNLASEHGYDSAYDNPDGIHIKSKIIIPLLSDDKLIGIATAYSSIHSNQEFSEYNFKVFKIITPYILNSLYQMHPELTSDRRASYIHETKQILSTLKEIEEIDSVSEDFNYINALVHDIGTPATNLHDFLSLLEEKVDDPRLKHSIHNAKESANFIKELTASILDTPSTTTNTTASECKVVNSIFYFSNIAQLFTTNMYNKQISFNVFIDPCIPKEIQVDALKLKRTIVNLIENAYKFTPSQGCIDFSVKYIKNESKLNIFIKDSGIGISKTKYNEILNIFKNSQKGIDTRENKNALGLAICACYVQGFDGHLQIDSTLNEGSTFHFDVPLKYNTQERSFQSINNPDAKIYILMDKHNSCSANNIARQLVALGIKQEQIKAIMSLENMKENATHLISFQNKISPEALLYCSQEKIGNLIVEEELFSISRKQETCSNLIISQYDYFTDTLYSFVNINTIPLVLIVDNNRINVEMLRGILKKELCVIEVANSGEMALEMIEQSLKRKRFYAVIYMDNFESAISCDEVLNKLRFLENRQNLPRTKVVSISGNAHNVAGRNSNYDIYVQKPFKKEEIINILNTNKVIM